LEDNQEWYTVQLEIDPMKKTTTRMTMKAVAILVRKLESRGLKKDGCTTIGHFDKPGTDMYLPNAFDAFIDPGP
jgi:hypothetical protein